MSSEWGYRSYLFEALLFEIRVLSAFSKEGFLTGAGFEQPLSPWVGIGNICSGRRLPFVLTDRLIQ
jgi:hypothetical protein